MFSASNYWATSPNVTAWQENLSNTAHQREMADFKAAGINPMLTAQTSGASTPSGNSEDFLPSMFNLMATTVKSSAKAIGQAADALKDKDDKLGLRGFFASLPDKGSTRLFGVSLPNATWKYLWSTYGDGLYSYVLEKFSSQSPAESSAPSARSPLVTSSGSSGTSGTSGSSGSPSWRDLRIFGGNGLNPSAGRINPFNSAAAAAADTTFDLDKFDQYYTNFSRIYHRVYGR